MFLRKFCIFELCTERIIAADERQAVPVCKFLKKQKAHFPTNVLSNKEGKSRNKEPI